MPQELNLLEAVTGERRAIPIPKNAKKYVQHFRPGRPPLPRIARFLCIVSTVPRGRYVNLYIATRSSRPVFGKSDVQAPGWRGICEGVYAAVSPRFHQTMLVTVRAKLIRKKGSCRASRSKPSQMRDPLRRMTSLPNLRRSIDCVSTAHIVPFKVC